MPADATYRAGVGINVDTLYSSARLDLASGPFVVTAPESGSRYYSLQFAFADSAAELSLGQRTHGSQLPPILVRGPGDQTPAPAGMLAVDCPTRYLLIAARFLFDPHVDGDLQTVRRLQDALTLHTCASVAAGVPAQPPVPEQRSLGGSPQHTPPGLRFLDQLGNVLRDWAIAADEAELVASFQHVALTPDHGFQPDLLSPAAQARAARGLADGAAAVQRKSLQLGETVNGWTLNRQGPRFGRDYLLRAGVARDQIYVTVPEEAIYPVGRTDDEGRPLTGIHDYRIRFAAGALPPVHAFWSITMYDDDGWLVDNQLSRYAVGDRTPGLTLQPDGAVEIALSQQRPDDQTVNWLPAPDGPFYVMLRLFIPTTAALSGQWQPPPIHRITVT